MTSGSWLRDHESMAALVFGVLSFALIGAFAWVERRFLQKQMQGELKRGPFLNAMLVIGLRYAALKRKILVPPPVASPDRSVQTAPEASPSVPASRR